jgi:integrase
MVNRASTSRLEPGQHTIDAAEAKPFSQRGRQVFRIGWSVRLHDGRLIKDQRTTGTSKAQAKRRAREKAKQLLTQGGPSRWKASDPIEKYLDQVVAKVVDESGHRENTLRQYRRVLRLYQAGLKGHSIASAMAYDVLADLLVAISGVNGAESARQARTVHSKYVVQSMRRHRLINHDPIGGAKLDLKRHAPARTGPRRGGQALDAGEQERVIAYLLDLDPESRVADGNRGRGGRAAKVKKQKNTIDLTLFQAGTGLRISEALQITKDLIELDADGQMYVNITAKIAKTGISRRAPVLDPRIQAHLEVLLQQPGCYLIGAPADPNKQWTRTGNGGATGQIAALYVEMATKLSIPLLEHQRSHMWRTTLNKRLEEAGVSQRDRAAILGHDEATNEASYTANSDTAAAVAAYRAST